MGWYHSMSVEEMQEHGLIDAPACSIGAGGPDKVSTSDEVVVEEALPSGTTSCPLPPTSAPPPPPPEAETIYHLCQKLKWDEAKALGEPYFPPTFIADGKFTRATVNKSDLVSTANLFYKNTPGKWIVLEIDCKTLYSLGIAILAQDAPESTKDEPVKCLQVFGGIATTLPGLIRQIYDMKRNYVTGEFLAVQESAVNGDCGCSDNHGKNGTKVRAEQAKKNKSGMKKIFGRIKK